MHAERTVEPHLPHPVDYEECRRRNDGFSIDDARTALRKRTSVPKLLAERAPGLLSVRIFRREPVHLLVLSLEYSWPLLSHPASLPIVSKMIFASLLIFRLTGARESGLISGGS